MKKKIQKKIIDRNTLHEKFNPLLIFFKLQDSFIQSKAVRYSQNGIVYTVDFNAEYKFRAKDCNKKPIVVCTFGMVSGPVRFEGDETYKCLSM